MVLPHLNDTTLDLNCTPLDQVDSPDMNVLDLCFSPSLQSLTDTRAPTNIRELIEDVKEEYENYEVNKLYRSFLTLQACMREVMKVGGGIKYDIPHLGKDIREKEGMLPTALSVKAKVLVDAKELILKLEAEKEEGR